MKRMSWIGLLFLAACGTQSGQAIEADVQNVQDGQIGDAAGDAAADAAGTDAVAADAAPADVPDVAAVDAQSGCNLAATAATLAGSGAQDCGHATLAAGDAPAVYTCAVTAMMAGKAVFALIDQQGIDSLITTALVRRTSGEIGRLEYDSDIGGGMGMGARIQWMHCKYASFAKPAGVDALHCEPGGEWLTLCPGSAQAPDAATQVVQWTATDSLAAVHVGAKYPQGYPPLPTAWSQLKLQKGVGPCPPGMTCSWTWTATPQGTVIGTEPNPDKKMSLAEVQELWELVGPASFLASMKAGFSCPPPPTDIGYTLEFTTQDGMSTQNVTGCVMGAPESVPAKVAKLLIGD